MCRETLEHSVLNDVSSHSTPEGMDDTKEAMSSKHNNQHMYELRDWGSSTRPALVQDSQGPSAESGKYAQDPIHTKKLSPADNHLQKTMYFSLIKAHKPHINKPRLRAQQQIWLSYKLIQWYFCFKLLCLNIFFYWSLPYIV